MQPGQPTAGSSRAPVHAISTPDLHSTATPVHLPCAPKHHLVLPRRLTPNFRVRVEVHYRGQVSFPLTLKCYVVTQQDKDSIPEWVPEDFLDPDLPQVGAWVGLQKE